MTSRGTPQDILRNYGSEAPLQVHRHLVYTVPRFATIECVKAVCKRNADVRDMALRRATQERTAYASDYLAFAIKAT